MNVSTVQRMIDRLWLVSMQRWVLSAVAVSASVAASTFVAIAAGHQVPVVLVLVAGLAIGAACVPDSHTALVLEGIVVCQWLAGTDDVTSPWAIPASLSLLVFHTVIALMAVTPISASVDRSILLRWARRSVYVGCATLAMWALVFVLHERRAPGSAPVTFVGFITLTALVVATRVANTSTPSDSS